LHEKENLNEFEKRTPYLNGSTIYPDGNSACASLYRDSSGRR